MAAGGRRRDRRGCPPAQASHDVIAIGDRAGFAPRRRYQAAPRVGVARHRPGGGTWRGDPELTGHAPRAAPGPGATSDPWGSRWATDTVVPGQGSARRPVTPGSAGPGRLSPRETARSSPSAARAWSDPESPASVARSEPGPPHHARARARGCRRSPVDGMRLEQPLSKPLTPAMVLITSHSMVNSCQIVGIMDPTTRSSSE